MTPWVTGTRDPPLEKMTPPTPHPHMHSCSQRDDSNQEGAYKRSAERNCKSAQRKKNVHMQVKKKTILSTLYFSIFLYLHSFMQAY